MFKKTLKIRFKILAYDFFTFYFWIMELELTCTREKYIYYSTISNQLFYLLQQNVCIKCAHVNYFGAHYHTNTATAIFWSKIVTVYLMCKDAFWNILFLNSTTTCSFSSKQCLKSQAQNASTGKYIHICKCNVYFHPIDMLK